MNGQKQEKNLFKREKTSKMEWQITFVFGFLFGWFLRAVIDIIFNIKSSQKEGNKNE